MVVLLFLHSYSTIRLFVCVMFCISSSVLIRFGVRIYIHIIAMYYIPILYILYQNVYQIGTEEYTYQCYILSTSQWHAPSISACLK